MKKIKTLQIIIIAGIIGLMTTKHSNAQATISTEDYKVLNNTSWEGLLTYLDYQSGKLTPVSTTMQIKISENAIEQNIQYTYEPNKNIKAITKIRKNGRYLGKQRVISKTVSKDGTTILITTAQGRDDNKKATMYYTYTFNTETYSVKKEVQFKGSEERFMRNKYEYKKL